MKEIEGCPIVAVFFCLKKSLLYNSGLKNSFLQTNRNIIFKFGIETILNV